MELIKSGHTLEIDRNHYVGGWEGFCTCSDPDYEDGWEGHVFFYGHSEAEVINQYEDHLAEEGVE